jgi:flagellar protein FlaJ
LTNFSKLLQKLISKDSFKEVSNSELFYQLIYMSAVAGAGISRSRIFELGANLPRVPADYFKRVHLLAQKLGYDYASACNKVGLAVKSDTMISLLLRLGNALTSGQPEADFLTEEASVQGEAYEKEYERDLEALTKWTDAYAAVNVSAALMIVINMTSSLIYDLGNATILGLVVTMLVIATATAWILSRAAPKEVIDLFSPEGTWPQRLAGQLVIYTVTAVCTIGALLMMLGLHIGPILIVVAVILFPLGLVSMLAGREIDKKDREFGPFLRSLGGMAVSTGTTITEALTRIDLSSFPHLETDLRRLRDRLLAAVEPELCWHKFALETGSKLIGETITIFNDAVHLGGDPDTVAFLSAEFSTRTIMLRAKRQVVAATFSWLTVVMHGTIATLMVIILEIIRNFVEMINIAAAALGEGASQAAALALPTFNAPQVEFFDWITIIMVILLSVVNAYAIIATDGGHRYKAAFYLSILLALAGLSFIVVPPLVKGILLTAQA